MNDIIKRLKLKTFEETFQPKIVEWLPDKRPTIIYVKSAIDAIFSLLSNMELMKEENISLPDKRDPTSPLQFPPMTMNSEIKELHHGKWWTESWEMKCTGKMKCIFQ